jgi:histone deacetylase HOS3
MSPAGKRGDLPVFSANGTIPFASTLEGTLQGSGAGITPASMLGQQGAVVQAEQEKKFQDMWEVPDTPAR